MVLVVSNKICLILFPPLPPGLCNIVITPPGLCNIVITLPGLCNIVITPPPLAVIFLEFSLSTVLYSEPLSVTTENCVILPKIF